MTVKDRFHGVSGLFETEHCVSKRKNTEQNRKSTTSTSNNHEFLVRTPIRAFLDSTENSLSLKFYKMKCSTKKWVENWAGSRIVEEWFVVVFGTSVFGTSFLPEMLGAVYGLRRELCVGCFVWYLKKLYFLY